MALNAPARVFSVPAANVRPLLSPPDFYEMLMSSVQRANRRITLASLYIGTGPREVALVQAIVQRASDVAAAGGTLAVAVQLDLCRSTRTASHGSTAYMSSAHLLLELIRAVPSADVGLTLMPQQRGLAGRMLPARLVEGAGVFHAKAYAFDDDVILSGANLSEDYFTRRQDRYVMLSNTPAFASYVHALVDDIRELPGGHTLAHDGSIKQTGCDLHGAANTCASAPTPVSSANFDATRLPAIQALQPSDPKLDDAFASSLRRTLWKYSRASPHDITGTTRNMEHACPINEARAVSPPSDDAARTRAAAAAIDDLREPSGTGCAQSTLCTARDDSARVNAEHGDTDTISVFPRLQLGALGVTADADDTLSLLRRVGPAPDRPVTNAPCSAAESVAAGDILHLATGYFNVTTTYAEALLLGAQSSSAVHVLTASPTANGFYGARGPAGAIPAAYSEIARDFVRSVRAAGRLNSSPVEQPAAPGIALYEYGRPGWTFHAKGLWLTTWSSSASSSGGNGAAVSLRQPVALTTLIGSPNFGRRSTERDLELQVEMRSTAPRFIRDFTAELDALRREVTPVHVGLTSDVWVTPERQLWGWSWASGSWIRVARRVLAPFF